MDEMQDMKLLRIEEAGFWLLFWVSFGSILLQLLMGAGLLQIAGEAVILFLASVFIVVSCLRNGLWSRGRAPTLKGNLLVSLLPAALVGILFSVRAFLILRRSLSLGTVGTILLMMLPVYIVCFAVLEGLRLIYRKRRSQLDGEDDAAG